MGFFDDTINDALERLEAMFRNSDKDGVIALGKELYEKDTSMLIMRTTGERFARQFPRDAGTLNYLWDGIGNWHAD